MWEQKRILDASMTFLNVKLINNDSLESLNLMMTETRTSSLYETNVILLKEI